MKTKTPLPEVGATIEFPYPFVRDKYCYMDEDGSCESPTWKPGIRIEPRCDDFDAVADAMGKQAITVLGVYRPGTFPTRVFYQRKWIDPDGKVFGKKACRVTTAGAFSGLTRGYRHSPACAAGPEEESPMKAKHYGDAGAGGGR